MLIGWQSLVLYGYLIIKEEKKFTEQSCSTETAGSTNAAKPHSCGINNPKYHFPVVAWRRDNLKPKDCFQTCIFEDLSWDIVLSHNPDIFSKYFSLIVPEMVLIAIQKF